MKQNNISISFIIFLLFAFAFSSCEEGSTTKVENVTALQEQAQTELNQRTLLQNQPPPRLSWSMERDQLTKRSLLQNDRTVVFFMYVFVEGVSEPIGYYQVNKVSSVNSQLTNPEQLIQSNTHSQAGYTYNAIPSPAEDGSYGSNGNGVFGFTPEGIYVETDMHYITSTVPLTFTKPVNRLAVINDKQAQNFLDISLAAMKQK